MDWFLTIVSVVVGILLVGVNFYLLALYCHRMFDIDNWSADDNGFGASLFCKVIVVLGLTLSWAQVLLMPLDIANNQYALSYQSILGVCRLEVSIWSYVGTSSTWPSWCSYSDSYPSLSTSTRPMMRRPSADDCSMQPSWSFARSPLCQSSWWSDTPTSVRLTFQCTQLPSVSLLQAQLMKVGRKRVPHSRTRQPLSSYQSRSLSMPWHSWLSSGGSSSCASEELGLAHCPWILSMSSSIDPNWWPPRMPFRNAATSRNELSNSLKSAVASRVQHYYLNKRRW